MQQLSREQFARCVRQAKLPPIVNCRSLDGSFWIVAQLEPATGMGRVAANPVLASALWWTLEHGMARYVPSRESPQVNGESATGRS